MARRSELCPRKPLESPIGWCDRTIRYYAGLAGRPAGDRAGTNHQQESTARPRADRAQPAARRGADHTVGNQTRTGAAEALASERLDADLWSHGADPC